MSEDAKMAIFFGIIGTIIIIAMTLGAVFGSPTALQVSSEKPFELNDEIYKCKKLEYKDEKN